MSDERKTRDAIERTAARIQNENPRQGRTISYSDAKGKAREIAVNYKRKYPQQ